MRYYGGRGLAALLRHVPGVVRSIVCTSYRCRTDSDHCGVGGDSCLRTVPRRQKTPRPRVAVACRSLPAGRPGGSGRRTGGHLNIRDVLSEHCQQHKGLLVERLDLYDQEEECWREALVEDRRAGPAEIAATRLDFAAWLRLLPGKLRRIAKVLASGETTGAAAKKFRVSAGRISQIRQELYQSWRQFMGEAPRPAMA